MRKLALINLCCAMSVLASLSALAADINSRRATPSEPQSVSPVYNWTGAYLGINGGGAWGRSDFGPPFTSSSFSASGALFGATFGYNWQAGQTVLGLEGDVDWTNTRGSATCGALSCETRNHWLGLARGRLGYAVANFMPFVAGGLAVGDISTTIAGLGSGNTTKAGWTLGGGLEASIYGPWTTKIEYLYSDLGRGGTVAGSDASLRTNILRGGVNYRF